VRANGRPVLGAIAGLFFGIFVAADLAQWSVRPLDNLGVIGFPIIGALLGIALGMWAPLGRRSSTPASPEPAVVTEATETESTTPTPTPEADQ
jgi:hypothetical protein